MNSDGCVVRDTQTGKTFGNGTIRHDLYYVDMMSHHGSASLAYGSIESKPWMWHRRLAHPSLGYLEQLFLSLAGSKLIFNSEACLLAKSHKLSPY